MARTQDLTARFGEDVVLSRDSVVGHRIAYLFSVKSLERKIEMNKRVDPSNTHDIDLTKHLLPPQTSLPSFDP